MNGLPLLSGLAAAILENEKTLGTRLGGMHRARGTAVKVPGAIHLF